MVFSICGCKDSVFYSIIALFRLLFYYFWQKFRIFVPENQLYRSIIIT